MEQTEEKKITLGVLGPSACGKTTMVINYLHGYYEQDTYNTIEDYYEKIINVGNQNVILKILDTGGSDDFVPQRTTWIRSSDGFLLMYSIDYLQSFEEIDYFYRDIMRTKGFSHLEKDIDLPIVLCACQCDRIEQRKVSQQEGEGLARELKIPFYESSAELNINVHEPFDEAVRLILNLKYPNILASKQNSDNSKTQDVKRLEICDIS